MIKKLSLIFCFLLFSVNAFAFPLPLMGGKQVVVASGNITAGNALCDTTTANAFCAPVGVDLSANQTGKYRLDLYSTATGVLWAQGFISATAPSGLALSGVELVTNGDMELDSGWTNQSTPTTNERSTTQKHGGTYSRHLYVLSGAGTGAISDTFSTTAGALYYRTAWGYPVAGGVSIASYQGFVFSPVQYIGANEATWINITKYSTCSTTASTERVFLSLSGGSGSDGYFDDISIQRLTMPAATGALLLSSYGGSRGFVFKHASFDPNAALSYKIVKVID